VAKKDVSPRFSGTFSVYDTDGGGIHIAWLPNDSPNSDTQHFDLPGPIITIIKELAAGKMPNPMELVKVMAANGMPMIPGMQIPSELCSIRTSYYYSASRYRNRPTARASV
jgi:hypothetical protein